MTVQLLKPVSFTHIHGIGSESYSSGPGKKLGEKVEDLFRKISGAEGGFSWKLCDWSHHSDLPDVGWIADVADLIIDVGRFSKDAAFRHTLREELLSVVDDKDCVVAHSLGSAIAVDTWIHQVDAGLQRGVWAPPFRKLITLGSPLGLVWGELNFRVMLERLEAVELPAEMIAWVRKGWLDLWNEKDPVATGSLFGVPVADSHSLGLQSAGYPCKSAHISSGVLGSIDAHNSYYDNPLLPTLILSHGGHSS